MTRHTTLLAALVLTALSAPSAWAAPPTRAYNFDTDAQGWTAQAGGALVHRVSKSGLSAYLQVTDVSSEDFVLVAPPDALGDWQRFLGGSISFRARNGNSDAPDWPLFGQVTLSDGVQTLVQDLIPPGEPAADRKWHVYTVPLTEAAWGPTLADLLKNVTSLTIKLEFHNGVSEVVHFDSYRLRPAPPL